MPRTRPALRNSATIALACLSLALTACSGQRAIHMVEQSGDRAMERGDYQIAASEYREVLDRSPARVESRIKYAQALLAAGDHRMAREQFEKAYTLRPSDDAVIEGLAESMVRSGDVESATRLLRTIAEERGRPADWVRLGRLHERLNDPDAAEKAYLTAARGDFGQSLEPQWALANLYRSVGNDAAALERLRMCLYLEPLNQQVRDMIREFGEVPGPSFAQRPSEQFAAPR